MPENLAKGINSTPIGGKRAVILKNLSEGNLTSVHAKTGGFGQVTCHLQNLFSFGFVKMHSVRLASRVWQIRKSATLPERSVRILHPKYQRLINASFLTITQRIISTKNDRLRAHRLVWVQHQAL